MASDPCFISLLGLTPNFENAVHRRLTRYSRQGPRLLPALFAVHIIRVTQKARVRLCTIAPSGLATRFRGTVMTCMFNSEQHL
jgi:hypothetical protein